MTTNNMSNIDIDPRNPYVAARQIVQAIQHLPRIMRYGALYRAKCWASWACITADEGSLLYWQTLDHYFRGACAAWEVANDTPDHTSPPTPTEPSDPTEGTPFAVTGAPHQLMWRTPANDAGVYAHMRLGTDQHWSVTLRDSSRAGDPVVESYKGARASTERCDKRDALLWATTKLHEVGFITDDNVPTEPSDPTEGTGFDAHIRAAHRHAHEQAKDAWRARPGTRLADSFDRWAALEDACAQALGYWHCGEDEIKKRDAAVELTERQQLDAFDAGFEAASYHDTTHADAIEETGVRETADGLFVWAVQHDARVPDITEDDRIFWPFVREFAAGVKAYRESCVIEPAPAPPLPADLRWYIERNDTDACEDCGQSMREHGCNDTGIEVVCDACAAGIERGVSDYTERMNERRALGMGDV